MAKMNTKGMSKSEKLDWKLCALIDKLEKKYKVPREKLHEIVDVSCDYQVERIKENINR